MIVKSKAVFSETHEVINGQSRSKHLVAIHWIDLSTKWERDRERDNKNNTENPFYNKTNCWITCTYTDSAEAWGACWGKYMGTRPEDHMSGCCRLGFVGYSELIINNLVWAGGNLDWSYICCFWLLFVCLFDKKIRKKSRENKEGTFILILFTVRRSIVGSVVREQLSCSSR